LLNTLKLILVGASWPIAAAGLVGLVAWIGTRRTGGPVKCALWLLIAPSIYLIIEFYMHSGGKPGEYARFAVFVDVALMLIAFLAIGAMPRGRIAAGMALVILAAVYSITYERGFVGDATIRNTRMKSAGEIVRGAPDNRTLYITAEPAPYGLPPVNLFYWRIVLLPAGGEVPPGSPPGILVKADDSYSVLNPGDTPISWAGKRFDVVPVSRK
jgi:hypothetical protein